jgi:hypothetical protein
LPSVSTSSVKARHTDQQRVSTGQNRNQRPLDNLVLTEDNRCRSFVRALDALGGRFEAWHDIGVGLDDIAHERMASLGGFRIGKQRAELWRSRQRLNLDDPARSS